MRWTFRYRRHSEPQTDKIKKKLWYIYVSIILSLRFECTLQHVLYNELLLFKCSSFNMSNKFVKLSWYSCPAMSDYLETVQTTNFSTIQQTISSQTRSECLPNLATLDILPIGPHKSFLVSYSFVTVNNS